MDFIDNLRQKSPVAKKQIAVLASAAVTLVIFGLWMTVFHFGINSNPDQNTASVANSADTDVNPFSAFLSVISKGWDGLTNNINQIKTGVGQAQNFVNGLSNASSTNNAGSQPISQKDVLILTGDSSSNSGDHSQTTP